MKYFIAVISLLGSISGLFILAAGLIEAMQGNLDYGKLAFGMVVSFINIIGAAVSWCLVFEN